MVIGRFLAALFIVYLISLKWSIYGFEEHSVLVFDFEKGDLLELDFFQEIRAKAQSLPLSHPSSVHVYDVIWDNMGGDQPSFSIYISYRDGEFSDERILSFREKQRRNLRSGIYDLYVEPCEDLKNLRWLLSGSVIESCMQKARDAATAVDQFKLTIRRGTSPSSWGERFFVYVLLLACLWCAVVLSKRVIRDPC